jgi:phosphoribosylamine--glycine ligase
MKILVVGSGGREHALVWALRRSRQVKEIHIAPGNGGTSELAVNAPIPVDNIPAMTDYAQQEHFDLVVIGPEIPLSLGLSDALQARGLRVFGPTALAARLESSKAFSKDFMRANGIPTADYRIFARYEPARRYLDEHPAPIVVKADGLAAGKGVIVCQSDAEARDALDQIMVKRAFGSAGDQVIIEECVSGQEVSVLAFVDGHIAVPMVLAQDHKAVYDSDRGPNTGGMGCYAPAPVLDKEMLARVQEQVLGPAVEGIRRLGTPYVGVLYAGLMVSGDQFWTLEFNCRFGDPEAQVILPLLKSDLFEVMAACMAGRLNEIELKWADQSCVCVVMASGGYPGHYARGREISGLAEAAKLPDTVVFHAGTKREHDRVLTDGGRVLGITAWADDLKQAIAQAYQAVECIHWQDAMYRHDIGAKGLRGAKGTGS